MRHRTGLRNRFRSGRSAYSKRNKGRYGDRYGTWDRGKRVGGTEVIAGRAMDYKIGKEYIDA